MLATDVSQFLTNLSAHLLSVFFLPIAWPFYTDPHQAFSYRNKLWVLFFLPWESVLCFPGHRLSTHCFCPFAAVAADLRRVLQELEDRCKSLEEVQLSNHEGVHGPWHPKCMVWYFLFCAIPPPTTSKGLRFLCSPG